MDSSTPLAVSERKKKLLIPLRRAMGGRICSCLLSTPQSREEAHCRPP